MIQQATLNPAGSYLPLMATPTPNKRFFTVAHDQAIGEALKLYGKDWGKVAKYVNDRCAKDFGYKTNRQLADHFRRSPPNSEIKQIKKRSREETDLTEAPIAKRGYARFSPEQDEALEEALKMVDGNSEWTKIASIVNQRCADQFGPKTPQQCRRRFLTIENNHPHFLQQLLESSIDRRGPPVMPQFYEEVEVLAEGTVAYTENSLPPSLSSDMLKIDDSLSSLDELLGIPSTPQSAVGEDGAMLDSETTVEGLPDGSLSPFVIPSSPQSEVCNVDDLPDIEGFLKDLPSGFLRLSASASDMPAMDPEENFSETAS